MGVEALKNRYRAALAKKRELKRLLKRFDEDFQASHGGKLPKRADKEVMRPQYQQYHDSKASLDALKVQIERSLGYFPEDLQGEGEGVAPSSGAGLGQGESSHAQSPIQEGASEGSLPLPIPVLNPTEARVAKSASAASPPAAESMLPASAPSDEELAKMSTGRLQEEKKNLHAYLKAYEKNFQSSNQRPVTKQEDIAPVAEEYRRYKSLKTLIAQRKGVTPGSDVKA